MQKVQELTLRRAQKYSAVCSCWQVSFMELYNEDLRDLLHPDAPSRQVLQNGVAAHTHTAASQPPSLLETCSAFLSGGWAAWRPLGFSSFEVGEDPKRKKILVAALTEHEVKNNAQ